MMMCFGFSGSLRSGWQVKWLRWISRGAFSCGNGSVCFPFFWVGCWFEQQWSWGWSWRDASPPPDAAPRRAPRSSKVQRGGRMPGQCCRGARLC
eukprot:490751-Hanusia_phi.AAC.1